MQFSDLNLIEPILRAVDEEWYTTPTPIQAQSIPIVLRWTDLLGCAQTGTGKTAAFAIPILQLLSGHRPAEATSTALRKQLGRRKLRSLIVTPTRELAVQIKESFQAYGRHTGLRCTVIFGGVGQHAQVSALREGVDILVATPGRLLDLMNQQHISLADIEIFVLDEADRMLDMGFIHDVKKLIAALPKQKQSLFFSATMPPEIVKLAHTILHNPEKVTVTPVSSTADIIKQSVYFVDRWNKSNLLIEILKDKSIKTALVFTRTKHGADKVVRVLLENNIKAEAIHGNKGQNTRQRALNNFKDQTTRVLVATDIAARGIDVDELEYVINYEVPNIPETYVHRIGRTGRAGAKWSAYSFCDAEEKAYLRDIEKLIGKKVPVIEGHPFPLMDNNPVKAPQPQRRGGNSFGYPEGKWPQTAEKAKREWKEKSSFGDKKPRPSFSSESAPRKFEKTEKSGYPKSSRDSEPKKVWKKPEEKSGYPKSSRDTEPKKSWKKPEEKWGYPKSKSSWGKAPAKPKKDYGDKSASGFPNPKFDKNPSPERKSKEYTGKPKSGYPKPKSGKDENTKPWYPKPRNPR